MARNGIDPKGGEVVTGRKRKVLRSESRKLPIFSMTYMEEDISSKAKGWENRTEGERPVGGLSRGIPLAVRHKDSKSTNRSDHGWVNQMKKRRIGREGNGYDVCQGAMLRWIGGGGRESVWEKRATANHSQQVPGDTFLKRQAGIGEPE